MAFIWSAGPRKSGREPMKPIMESWPYHLPEPWEISRKFHLHPWNLTWNIKITRLKRKLIFQTSIFRFHVNFPGCIWRKTLEILKLFQDLQWFLRTLQLQSWCLQGLKLEIQRPAVATLQIQTNPTKILNWQRTNSSTNPATRTCRNKEHRVLDVERRRHK